jgi:hypothetical protein
MVIQNFDILNFEAAIEQSLIVATTAALLPTTIALCVSLDNIYPFF